MDYENNYRYDSIEVIYSSFHGVMLTVCSIPTQEKYGTLPQKEEEITF
jgi:hypothetical protein